MPQYDEIPRFPNLDRDFCMKLQDLAQLGLSRDEILHGESLEWDQLTKDEQSYFMKLFNRGQRDGKAEVARHLIKHSGAAGGMPATMAYLRRFATNFEKALDETEGLTEGFSFIFTPRKDQ